MLNDRTISSVLTLIFPLETTQVTSFRRGSNTDPCGTPDRTGAVLGELGNFGTFHDVRVEVDH